jgi:hypothetical protein
MEGDGDKAAAGEDVEANGGGPAGTDKHSTYSSMRGRKDKPGFIASQQQRMSKTLSGMQDVLNRMMCIDNSFDDVEMTISPYVRFVWILSLGVMDISLVLVLIFWPQRDFMCSYDAASGSVVLEKNIISTIGVILGLHAGDVVLPPPPFFRKEEGAARCHRFLESCVSLNHTACSAAFEGSTSYPCRASI